MTASHFAIVVPYDAPSGKKFHTFLRRHHSPRMYALPKAVGVPTCPRALLTLAMIKARMVKAYGVIISK